MSIIELQDIVQELWVRLPTERIHHPWNIVVIDAANARLHEALAQMWQHEADSRAVTENGIEEGLGDSSESPPIAFPHDMEEDHTDLRNNPTTTTIRKRKILLLTLEQNMAEERCQ
ncbi:hypothetical protein POM88_005289 [Heracleum sosnowskyi]|uniref:Uncharacterized protein n=1 Tax=Heracleum sosnowskyi TaxID=360622 RepID=A0AAD8JJV6_9APIA|nr:hypothetical protein POM88_005289 [Heracleum sosnowskyi]